HNKEFNNYIRDYLYHPNALPNIIHKFIYELEAKGKLNSLITQNIDDLHKLAGSKHFIPIHGSINNWHCIECEKKYNIKDLNLNESTICECGGIIRPDIVLYLEPTDETYCHLATVKGQIADMIIVIGSSLSVSTATNILKYYAGNKLVIINKEKTSYDKYADLVINDNAENVIEELMK
nr:hypothetical protein [Acholeplasmatales bacterium]